MDHPHHISKEKTATVRVWLRYFVIFAVIFLFISVLIFYFRVKRISREIKEEQAAQELNQIEQEKKYETTCITYSASLDKDLLQSVQYLFYECSAQIKVKILTIKTK